MPAFGDQSRGVLQRTPLIRGAHASFGMVSPICFGDITHGGELVKFGNVECGWRIGLVECFSAISFAYLLVTPLCDRFSSLFSILTFSSVRPPSTHRLPTPLWNISPNNIPSLRLLISSIVAFDYRELF
jgi:hypothetical protein